MHFVKRPYASRRELFGSEVNPWPCPFCPVYLSWYSTPRLLFLFLRRVPYPLEHRAFLTRAIFAICQAASLRGNQIKKSVRCMVQPSCDGSYEAALPASLGSAKNHRNGAAAIQNTLFSFQSHEYGQICRLNY